MLEFYPVQKPDTLFLFIENHELGNATWIVSDLKSKNEIQKILLDQQGYFLETSILRASDFWKMALRRLAPHIQVVSSEFVKIIVDNFVEKHGAALDIRASESSTLHAYLLELAPILLHPESDSVLAEWFSQQKQIKKWQRWYLLARACMKSIVHEHQIIDSGWTAAFLQNLNIEALDWKTPIIVDLGTEMSSVEMGLFKSLAQKADVKIIWPKPSWHPRFQFLLKTYQDSSGYGQSVPVKGDEATILSNNQFLRFSTQLAEIKFAVSQIRVWIDSGVALNNIAVVAAEIDKSYWPVLKFFLDEEGLVYQKDSVVKVNSLAAVQNFTAYCANLMSDVGWETLETSVFSKRNVPELAFDTFKSLFYQLYDESDLLRDEKVKSLFYKKIDLQRKLGRDEFLIEIVKIWAETLQSHGAVAEDLQPNLFEVIFKDFLARSTNTTTFFKNWFQFLQACINSKEIKIAASTSGGLQILPLMSSHLTKAEYQIFLGIDEKSLATRGKSLIPTADVFELKTKFDFAIEFPEESFYDFNTRWLSERFAKQKYFLCANSSFEAEPLTPALFFLENNPRPELTVPEATRHDQIQNHFLATVTKTGISEGLRRDLFPEENIVIVPRIESISPSELEDYWNCHFKVLAQKAFRLRDIPQAAVDLDPRQKGSLLHLLFEYLAKNEKLSEPSLFLDQKRIELKIYPEDDLLWNIQKNKLLQIGTQFINFENSRKKVNLKATEASFEMFFDLERLEFVAAESVSSRSVKIRGRVDRIDQDPLGLIIYDYKSTTSDLKNHADWLSKGEFQLLLYLIACEKYLYPDKSVMASVYYDYRKLEASKGLILETYQNQYLSGSRKRKSLADEEVKSELLNEFSKTLEVLLAQLENFDFTAKPVDPKICSDCNWSQLCRAPHLM